jgi:outer membrane lipoprotein-sorting protein
MNTMKWVPVIALFSAGMWSGQAHGQSAPDAAEVLRKVLESDPWGLDSASIVAHASMTDKHSAQTELGFTAKSKRLGSSLSESLVRFSQPPELVGAGFLQIQKQGGDDDRFLFLPELKRARRISGSLRSNSFMGTDMSYADLDRRDLREGTPALKEEQTVGKFACFLLDVTPHTEGSQYSHIEMWVRKDNYLPLKMRMYDHHNALLKTFEAQEVKRVGGAWYVSKSRMTNEQQNHTTIFVLDQITAATGLSDDDFTVRALEKP